MLGTAGWNGQASKQANENWSYKKFLWSWGKVACISKLQKKKKKLQFNLQKLKKKKISADQALCVCKGDNVYLTLGAQKMLNADYRRRLWVMMKCDDIVLHYLAQTLMFAPQWLLQVSGFTVCTSVACHKSYNNHHALCEWNKVPIHSHRLAYQQYKQPQTTNLMHE